MDEQATERQTHTTLGVRSLPMIVLAAAVAVFAIRQGAPLLAPILVSVLLAYALEPFVAALMRLGLPRIAAAALVFTMLAIIMGGMARTARLQVDAFLADLPKSIASMRHAIDASHASAREPSTTDLIQRAIADLEAAIDADASAGTTVDVQRVIPVPRRFSVRDYLMEASFGLAELGVQLSVIALLTFLLIVAGDLFKRKLIALAGPARIDKKRTLDVIRTIDRQIERYLIVRVLISVIVASATATALWLAGLRDPIVWGAIAGLLNVLPFIGPAVACAAMTAAAFLQFHHIEPTLIVGGSAAAIATLEGNLLSPWLTGRAGELNTVAVFVCVLFWGWAWDVWGLALAVPMTVALKAAADHIDPLRPLGELLGR